MPRRKSVAMPRGNDDHGVKIRFTAPSHTRTPAKRFAAKDFPYTNDFVTRSCKGIMTPERCPQSFCDSETWMAMKLTPLDVVFVSRRGTAAAAEA